MCKCKYTCVDHTFCLNLKSNPSILHVYTCTCMYNILVSRKISTYIHVCTCTCTMYVYILYMYTHMYIVHTCIHVRVRVYQLTCTYHRLLRREISMLPCQSELVCSVACVCCGDGVCIYIDVHVHVHVCVCVCVCCYELFYVSNPGPIHLVSLHGRKWSPFYSR